MTYYATATTVDGNATESATESTTDGAPYNGAPETTTDGDATESTTDGDATESTTDGDATESTTDGDATESESMISRSSYDRVYEYWSSATERARALETQLRAERNTIRDRWSDLNDFMNDHADENSLCDRYDRAIEAWNQMQTDDRFSLRGRSTELDDTIVLSVHVSGSIGRHHDMSDLVDLLVSEVDDCAVRIDEELGGDVSVSAHRQY